MLRVVKASSNAKPEKIVSRFPIDSENCVCFNERKNWMKGDKDYYTCPNSKDKKRYKVICNVCKNTVALVYADNDKLDNWCDLHYVTECDGDKWNGCMAVNLSPVDRTLGFECTCGNDTRDFRANTTIPFAQAQAIEKENSKGRVFGKKYSKFIITEV